MVEKSASCVAALTPCLSMVFSFSQALFSSNGAANGRGRKSLFFRAQERAKWDLAIGEKLSIE